MGACKTKFMRVNSLQICGNNAMVNEMSLVSMCMFLPDSPYDGKPKLKTLLAIDQTCPILLTDNEQIFWQ